MKRIAWVVILGSAALAGCGGTVTGMPGGAGASGGSGGSAGTSGSGGNGGTSGSGGNGGTSGSGGGSGCCTSNSDCQPGFECAVDECLPRPMKGCWSNADCGPNQHCAGATVCSCGSICGPGGNALGTCERNSDCCGADADCGSGQECVSGKCKPKPAPGWCWRDSDCQFDYCSSAFVCPCGAGSTCTRVDTEGGCPSPTG